MLTWFESNSLKANPDKLQLITFNRNKDIYSTLEVVVSGQNDVLNYIDDSLCFNDHISYLC